MTLPFRRRHHDDEASHDRARAIVATGFIEPTAPDDADWLEGHLAGCGECRIEMDAYRADRDLLRSLRDVPPEPPRDLWARTAASIERERSRRERGALPAAAGQHLGRRLTRLPIGVLSGVLVVLVVVGTSLIPTPGSSPFPPDGSGAALASGGPVATPLVVTAKGLSWVQATGDGSFELVFARVDEVCITDPDACAPLEDAASTRLALSAEPQAVVLSPSSEQLVIVSAATADGGGEVLVVSVPRQGSVVEPAGSPSIIETPPPDVPTPAPTSSASLDPRQTLGPSESPVASPDPNAPRAILSGVIVVGDTAYSADGRWLAFSARPMDGSAGPDLYLWRVGDATAAAVTADHRTFFAGWLGNQVLASRVEAAQPTPGEASPDPSASAEPIATAAPATTAAPASTATPDPAASPEAASPPASEPPLEDRPVSFLLDPETAAVTALAGPDIWRPIVSPSTRTIVYWSGTLVPDGTGTGWALGTGQLVLDGWVDPAAPPPADPDSSASPDGGASPAPSASASASARQTPTAPASIDPAATVEPTLPPGPAGLPIVLAAGPIAAFEASFDPSGTRLAVWVADPANVELGLLRLVALEEATGQVLPDLDPLPGVAAVRGFSIGEGRLAWVTPPGQDGESSHVHVLAWTNDDFGQVRSMAMERPVVAR